MISAHTGAPLLSSEAKVMIFFEKRILRGGKCGEKGVYLHCGMTALLPSGYLEKGRVYFYTALKRP
jgi:hypothetical protein